MGDAVWWNENHNSGVFYGDPIYSPTAIRLNYLNDVDYITGIVALSGSTVNGRDLSVVNTQYEIDYCPGDDFFVCDQSSRWMTTGLSGIGGQINMALGNWDTTALEKGPYTLRLKVTSNNPVKNRSQSLYDYYPVTVYDPSGDDDSDGLTNIDELEVYSTNPLIPDSDNDTLLDGDEVFVHGTNPLSTDSDNDTMPDNWEVANNTDPTKDDTLLDTDKDGLNNFAEFEQRTDPHNEDTDQDGLRDGDEVNIYLTNPLVLDTDYDSLSDGDEVNLYNTDPLSRVDTDNDSLPDDWENVRGTDPAVADALLDSDDDGANNVLEFMLNTLPLDATSAPTVRDIYIDQRNSSGVEDGSQQNPYSTFAAGMAEAAQGDTLIVASGSYNLGFYTTSKNIRVVGPAEGGVIFYTTYFFPSSGYWSEYSNIDIVASNLVYLLNVRNIVIKNSTIQAAQGTLIFRGASAIFENTVFKPDGTAAALSVRGTAQLNNVTITGFGVGVDQLDADASVRIHNSILANTIDLQGVVDGSGIDHSLISDAQFTGVNGNIAGDPLFVDASNGDYHLLSASPAIDAGDVNNNYANEPEPNACRINMGAYGNTAQASVSTEDADNDGLYGYCETRAGSDTTHPDSDYDTINDGQEVQNGSDPLSLFSPAHEGINLSNDATFRVSTQTYLSTDLLHILAWTDVVGAAAGNTAYTLTGGDNVLSGELVDQGDGSYLASVSLSSLNYTGNDVLVNIRIRQKKKKYIDQRVISVTGDTNAAPSVSITSPVNGTSVDSGSSVTLTCSASDPEDGDLSASCAWTSNLDGNLGSGSNLSLVLSDGTHLISASVTDSAARLASDSISITVGTVSTPIDLTATGYKVKRKQRVDLSWSGATSGTVDIFRDDTLLKTVTNSGMYTDNIGIKGAGNYSYRVCEAGTSTCSADVNVVF